MASIEYDIGGNRWVSAKAINVLRIYSAAGVVAPSSAEPTVGEDNLIWIPRIGRSVRFMGLTAQISGSASAIFVIRGENKPSSSPDTLFRFDGAIGDRFVSPNLGNGDLLKVDIPLVIRCTVGSSIVGSVFGMEEGPIGTNIDGEIPFGDARVDQIQPNNNLGAGNLFIQADIAANEQRGLLEFDFTPYAGQTAKPGGVHQFTFFANHDQGIARTLIVRFSTQGTQPFKEMLVTWNNQPAEVNFQFSVNQSIANGPAATYTITLTDAQLNAFLGNWVYMRMLTADLPVLFQVRSRETGNQNNIPRFLFELA